MKTWGTINRILLGLLMLVSGLLKLFVVGADGVSGMLSGIVLFSWAPFFWAWLLMLGEIISGAAILANYKLKYFAIIPIIVLVIATLFMGINLANLGQTSWSVVLLHLVAISNYVLLAQYGAKKEK
ncbi:DoxX family membrane protein [Candidatus Pacearchaeota archaeon]|nr:DoxX family membrane protein [Candidatus Pacearchaeota archaeon]